MRIGAGVLARPGLGFQYRQAGLPTLIALSFLQIPGRSVSVHQLGDLSRPPHERDEVALHLIAFLGGCCWPFALHGVHEGVKVLDVLV